MKRQTKIYLQKTAILLIVYFFLRFLLPLVMPFFLAWTTVYFLISVQKKIHIKLFPLSLCFLVVFMLLVGSLVLCGGCLLYEPCKNLIPICQQYWHQCSQYLSWIPKSASGILMGKMPFMASMIFNIFIYFISVLLFAKDWEAFHMLLIKVPFSDRLSKVGYKITQSLKGWTKAQGKIMLVVTVECAIGYFLLDIPIFLFWAVLTGFVDALPIFGTGTIFIPWLIIVILQKDYTFALWLALLFLITWLTRELLEPKLLGDGLGLLPIVFLMSVIVGLKLFGAFGLFSGPFGVLLVKELWTEII